MLIKALQVDGQRLNVPSDSPNVFRHFDPDWATIVEVMELLHYVPKTQPVNGQTCFRRQRIRAGQSLHTMKQAFNGVYIIRTGAFKSIVRGEDGSEHVISFSIRGDMLGTDGIFENYYRCEAVALTACNVIRIPPEAIFSSHRLSDEVEKMLCWSVSREMSRELATYALVHTSKAVIRVARFLLAQSDRFSQNGWSARRFTLTMSRREIGSYLNVTLETVSRAFAKLHRQGIIEVYMRNITICSMVALRNFEG